MKILTLGFLVRNRQILLAMKKRGFGVGKWNGVGGKLELGETVEQGLRREVYEEIEVACGTVVLLGKVVFEGTQKEPVSVWIYAILDWEGEPRETEEMRPQWFEINQLPFDDMWPDNRNWMPLFLAGKQFNGQFRFEDDEIQDFEINEVAN